MKLATFLLATAILACGAAAYTQPAFPIDPNVKTTKITNRAINHGLFQTIVNLPSMVKNGSFSVNAPGQATEPVEVSRRG